MKHITFAISLFFFLAGYCNYANAQFNFQNNSEDNPIIYEGGISIGPMNSLTDVGGKEGIGRRFIKDLNIGFTYLSGGVYVSALYDNKFALRLEATMGKLSAHDSVLRDIKSPDISKARYNRNLGFRSNIKEAYLITEIHFLYILSELFGEERDPPRYSPYLIGGIGYFSFKPQALLGTEWIDLQPLHTEGQGFKEYPQRSDYKLQQWMVPVGGGLKYDLSQRLTIRGEFVLRKLFTDYLDDLSTTYINPAVFSNYFSGTQLSNALALHDRQLVSVTDPNGGSKRGTLTENDAYFTFNLKVGFSIGKKQIDDVQRRQRNQLKCPVFY